MSKVKNKTESLSDFDVQQLQDKVGSLKNELVKIKKLYKDAYIKKSFIN